MAADLSLNVLSMLATTDSAACSIIQRPNEAAVTTGTGVPDDGERSVIEAITEYEHAKADILHRLIGRVSLPSIYTHGEAIKCFYGQLYPDRNASDMYKNLKRKMQTAAG
jgi:hypothetical protein